MYEPTWTSAEDGVYTRPLLGSEALADGISVLAEGTMEVCHGLSFTTDLGDKCIIDRVHNAMLRLRFDSPLVAAQLVPVQANGNTDVRQWEYTTAKTYEEAVKWCQCAVVVHERAPSSEDFIATANAKRLPYVVDQYSLFFTCHLLLRESGTHSLFFHGTHAIMDAIPTLEALAQMLGWISVPQESYLYPVSSLKWGSEWANLPEGPVTTTGGPKEGCESEVPHLLHRMEEIISNPTPTATLHPQRNEIREQGRALRIHRSIDRVQTAALIRAVKALGFNVTVLFEAAQILATFARCNLGPDEWDTAHVTLDASIIALKRRFVAPYNRTPRFASAMTTLPTDVVWKDIKDLDGKTRMNSIMATLKAQYAVWNASPHLPWLGSHYFRTSPHAGLITNIGVVENIVQRLWPDEENPVIEVHDMAFGHRNAHNPRPMTHLWTMDSTIYLQIQASDMWDEEYLQSYMDDIVSNALLLL